jgi:HPt (histidine-containing phosphotransfer) domain-containing protein
MDALDRLAAGDVPFKLDLIDTFIAVGGAQLDDIDDALERADPAAISHFAHKLKGNSGCVFAGEVSLCAAQLEMLIAQPGDLREPAFRQMVDELRAKFTRAVEFLRAEST